MSDERVETRSEMYERRFADLEARVSGCEQAIRDGYLGLGTVPLGPPPPNPPSIDELAAPPVDA